MRPEAIEEAQDWLTRAERDLLVAERSLQGPMVLADAAAYHAQQAAEKALKGFLAAHEQPFPKTHDLLLLVTQCQNIDQDFTHFLSTARTLTPYAVRFRYPGGPLEPEASAAQEAFQLASELVQFVRMRMQSDGLS